MERKINNIMKSNFEYEDVVKITEEAAEIMYSHEPNTDFDFNQHGIIIGRYTIGRNVIYRVRFADNRVLNLPQSYIEKIEE